MKFENTQITNFEGAFRGLRNPLESWAKSDSLFGIEHLDYIDEIYQVSEAYAKKDGYECTDDDEEWYRNTEKYTFWLQDNGVLRFNSSNDVIEYAFIGPNDLDLAQRMIKAGSSDSKFLRQIFVSVDITAPLYWWKEADTYKVATTANSTSTMHKLASTPITIDCFEIDDMEESLMVDPPQGWYTVKDFYTDIIESLEYLRQRYNETKDQRYWKELIRWLPEGWLQTRTWTSNYAGLRNMYFQREHHRLSEWHQFCDWVKKLPYAKELILYTGED